jgi:hypothetical protein
MSTVQEIKDAIPKLAPKDVLDVKEWLDDWCEDQLELADEVKTALARSHAEIAAGRFITLQS